MALRRSTEFSLSGESYSWCQGKARDKKVAKVKYLEDGPRMTKSSHLVVLSFGSNYLAPFRAGLLPLLVCQAIRFDPTLLDEHDLPECNKWSFRVHPILVVARRWKELLTRFDGVSCYYHVFVMNDFEAAVFLLPLY